MAGLSLVALGYIVSPFFLRLFNSLGLLLKRQYFKLLGFGLRLFCPRDCHIDAMYIAFVVGSGAVLALLVYFLNEQSRLETCFDLSINPFHNYFCSAVLLLALPFYLGFY